jgi:DNA-binding winged helix-turn-helix (wHTH) protein
MIIQNLIIYNFTELSKIFEELNLDLKFKITFIQTRASLDEKIDKLDNCLILSNKKLSNIKNQIVLDDLPVNFSKLVEKINIEFLKYQFNQQSRIKIQNYTIDLNSREIQRNQNKLRLTEKEINTIIFLSKMNKPVRIDDLQKKVWGYQSNMETHTVETHIYRLRQKILKTFDDHKFIISEKNGYQIYQKI